MTRLSSIDSVPSAQITVHNKHGYNKKRAVAFSGLVNKVRGMGRGRKCRFNCQQQGSSLHNARVSTTHREACCSIQAMRRQRHERLSFLMGLLMTARLGWAMAVDPR